MTSVRHGILGLLARRPAHGYDLKKSFEALAGAGWALNFGQVYTTLERLRAEGLVEAEEGPRAGVRERLTYYITSDGLDALADWVREPVRRARPTRDDLQVKLLFADRRRPQLILGLLDEQRRLLRGRLAEARAAKAQVEADVGAARGRRMMTRSTVRAESDTAPGSTATQALDRAIRLALAEAAVLRIEADLRWLDLCEDQVRAAMGSA